MALLRAIQPGSILAKLKSSQRCAGLGLDPRATRALSAVLGHHPRCPVVLRSAEFFYAVLSRSLYLFGIEDFRPVQLIAFPVPPTARGFV